MNTSGIETKNIDASICSLIFFKKTLDKILKEVSVNNTQINGRKIAILLGDKPVTKTKIELKALNPRGYSDSSSYEVLSSIPEKIFLLVST